MLNHIIDPIVQIRSMPGAWLPFALLSLVGSASTLRRMPEHRAPTDTGEKIGIAIIFIATLIGPLFWISDYVAGFTYLFILNGAGLPRALGFVVLAASFIALPAYGVYTLMRLIRSRISE